MYFLKEYAKLVGFWAAFVVTCIITSTIVIILQPLDKYAALALLVVLSVVWVPVILLSYIFTDSEYYNILRYCDTYKDHILPREETIDPISDVVEG